MTIKLEYFSDFLCFWAYGGQVRLDELKRDFADDKKIEYRFVPNFGSGKQHNYRVPGSPTLVLNEGRQLLYGNVGYRIIDANVRELMYNPGHGEASWC